MLQLRAAKAVINTCVSSSYGLPPSLHLDMRAQAVVDLHPPDTPLDSRAIDLCGCICDCVRCLYHGEAQLVGFFLVRFEKPSIRVRCIWNDQRRAIFFWCLPLKQTPDRYGNALDRQARWRTKWAMRLWTKNTPLSKQVAFPKTSSPTIHLQMEF
jgi:hypothetical protein